MGPRLQQFIDSNQTQTISTLQEWLRIPSISAQPDHKDDVMRSAEHGAELLRQIGFNNVQLLSAGAMPAIYGDWLHAPGKPTVLIYGHHDVQPVDPLNGWNADPFDPVVVGDEIRARGASDDKGQMVMQIEAARGLLEAEGALPLNVKFLIEGEEEVGSPTLETLLGQHADLLRCDLIIVSDTGMWSEEIPGINLGMRGLVGYDVTIRTAQTDLHSGVFGGAVPNSAHVLADFVSSLHDKAGRVTIPGFYDDVDALSEVEQQSLNELPFDIAEFKSQATVEALTGEDGYSPLEQTTVRPTCEVTGITTGYGGDGIKTIVPATGNCKIAFRLVASQDPQKIAKQFEKWVSEQIPTGIEVTLTPEGAMAPAFTPPDHPANEALARAIRTVWKRDPVFTREGGSGPEETLERKLDAYCIYLGVMLHDDHFHAPNERLRISQLWKGIMAGGELLHELADLPIDAFAHS